MKYKLNETCQVLLRIKMCFECFKNVNLVFLVVCLDCSKDKQVNLKLGKFYQS